MSINFPNNVRRFTVSEYSSFGIKSYPSKDFKSLFLLSRDKKSLISGQMEETSTISGTVKTIGVFSVQADFTVEKYIKCR